MTTRFGRVKANLRMGVVGLPNVGKSSLFNLLTEQSVPAENFPFCTIEPNEARCAVPDARYDFLCKLWKSPSLIPAYLMVTDIAGLIKGAAEGAGLGNAFLSHIQAVDGIYHCIRIFDNDDVIHVDDSIDPIRDLETIQTELCKKDLEILKKAVAAEELAVKKSAGKMKLSPTFINATEKLQTMLSKNISVRSGEWSTTEVEMINDKMRFITTKPIVYLANMTKADYLRKKNKWLAKIHAWIQAHGGGVLIPFSIEFEEEYWGAEDKAAYLKECGAEGIVSALPKIITTGYKELNLVNFFTAGEKEVRSWTVYGGAVAPEAASVIHTDFAKGFIKAEVAAFADFKEHHGGSKSMASVKAAGKYRIEGKTYVVKDGDICHFQIGTITQGKK
ncbi:P-loop containing nucleoside triphosphate hydrolase protein [Chytriomyces cf. hyalinus JEL632]|nr:P-loop containing nucleoside triphosphate hydrolase protein [Chytriomyces cf. hyalinus JEL632]